MGIEIAGILRGVDNYLFDKNVQKRPDVYWIFGLS